MKWIHYTDLHTFPGYIMPDTLIPICWISENKFKCAKIRNFAILRIYKNAEIIRNRRKTLLVITSLVLL